MEHVEYPSQNDFLECKNCNAKVIFKQSSFKERRNRLIDFLEEHLATCYQRDADKAMLALRGDIREKK